MKGRCERLLGAVRHVIESQELGIHAHQIRTPARIGHGGQNFEVVLAGEEDLAILELDLDDRIGLAAHCHRVVAEIVRIRIAGQVEIVGCVQGGLKIQDQIHDRALVLVIRGVGGGDRHLTDDLARTQIHPQNESHILRQHTALGGTIGRDLLGGHGRQPEEVLILGGVGDLEPIMAVKDDEPVLFLGPEMGRQTRC